MAAKSLVKAVTLIDTFLPAVVVAVLDDFVDDPPHATKVTAAIRPTAIRDTRLDDTFIVPSRFGNTC
jgi:hypothetical protein